ncbi:hypothetical protein BJ085DRAFT_27626 [Dimargaris cristalligena]|uniref:Uncharacterized protein n=1 Tax=Dimargaris cristalligena TaxID=215637 RepID=A0A4P9ZNU9_9FUNG|nr:hypothetical protein BJ085DRAFT_27626 [Dimargaris cristalligena]|eukprot:RKP34838.1 hypothetical protein BJ085DRAFT_27626 [Dimargaris cristalligena]
MRPSLVSVPVLSLSMALYAACRPQPVSLGRPPSELMLNTDWGDDTEFFDASDHLDEEGWQDPAPEGRNGGMAQYGATNVGLEPRTTEITDGSNVNRADELEMEVLGTFHDDRHNYADELEMEVLDNFNDDGGGDINIEDLTGNNHRSEDHVEKGPQDSVGSVTQDTAANSSPDPRTTEMVEFSYPNRVEDLEFVQENLDIEDEYDDDDDDDDDDDVIVFYHKVPTSGDIPDKYDSHGMAADGSRKREVPADIFFSQLAPLESGSSGMEFGKKYGQNTTTGKFSLLYSESDYKKSKTYNDWVYANYDALDVNQRKAAFPWLTGILNGSVYPDIYNWHQKDYKSLGLYTTEYNPPANSTVTVLPASSLIMDTFYFKKFLPFLFALAARYGNLETMKAMYREGLKFPDHEYRKVTKIFLGLMVLEFDIEELFSQTIKIFKGRGDNPLLCARFLGYNNAVMHIKNNPFDVSRTFPDPEAYYSGLGYSENFIVNRPADGGQPIVALRVRRSEFLKLVKDGENAILSFKESEGLLEQSMSKFVWSA